MKWEYSVLQVLWTEQGEVVIAINQTLQDFEKSPTRPEGILNEMGEEGWELISVVQLISSAPNAIEPRGLWKYLLKRERVA